MVDHRGESIAGLGGHGSYNWGRLRPDAPVIFGSKRKRTVAAEQYRKLAVQVEQQIVATKESGYVLAISSPEPGTGKTLTSLNLALALARGGERRVLLVECDLRVPSLSGYFEFEESPVGLYHLLESGAQLSKAIVSVWAAGLDIITAGRGGEVENLMADPAMAQFLMRARSRYEVIVLDSPPFLLASGRTVAGLAHGVLIVARAGQTKIEGLEEVLSNLGPSKLLGITLNDLPARRLSRETYGAYGYYFRDGKRRRRRAPEKTSAAAGADQASESRDTGMEKTDRSRVVETLLRLARHPLALAGLLTAAVVVLLSVLPDRLAKETPSPSPAVTARASLRDEPTEPVAAAELESPSVVGEEASPGVEQQGADLEAVTETPVAEPTEAVVEAATSEQVTRDLAEFEMVEQRLAAGVEWLTRADEEHYTVQLMLVEGERVAQVEKFLRRSDVAPLLEKVYLYRAPLRGREMLGIVYGDYAGSSLALEAIRELPRSLAYLDPYVRDVGAIASQLPLSGS